MYSLIVSPITGRKVSVNGKLGKSILRNYINVLYGGSGYSDVAKGAPGRNISDFLTGDDKKNVAVTKKRNLVRMSAHTRRVDLESTDEEWFDTTRPVYIFTLNLYNKMGTPWTHPRSAEHEVSGLSVIQPNIKKLIKCADEGAICELHIVVSPRDPDTLEAIVFNEIEKCLTLTKIRVIGRDWRDHTFPSFFFPSISTSDVLPNLRIELIPSAADRFLAMSPEHLHLNNPDALTWLLNKMGREITIKSFYTNMFTTQDSIRSPISYWETLVSARPEMGRRGDLSDTRPVFDERLIKLKQLIEACMDTGPIKITIEEVNYFRLIDVANTAAPDVLQRATHVDYEQVPLFSEDVINPTAFTLLTEYGFVKELVTPDQWEPDNPMRDETYLVRRKHLALVGSDEDPDIWGWGEVRAKWVLNYTPSP